MTEEVLTMPEITKLLMQAALLFVAERLLAFSLPAVMLLVYLVQKVYLRTSRQLRFLELESKAAVFSSFLESVGTSPRLCAKLILSRSKVLKQSGLSIGVEKLYEKSFCA